ncbi:rhodanese-related sulfurtransferase [Pelagibacteraceae bacterium]|nr:rhodanese-related sulfurtransferase [Pelagibacteraceae bacterium]
MDTINKLYVYTFYRFKQIDNIMKCKSSIDNNLKHKYLRGTIIIANEGINGSLSGNKKDLDECIKFIKSIMKIRKLIIKINTTEHIPFNRMKVRLKKEIVSLGRGKIDVNKYRGKLINAEDWNRIISDQNTKIVDVRNDFEIGIGKFQKSLNPKTTSFREFPRAFQKLNINKNDKVAMYCTGGIRCEKASSYLKNIGFKNVVQLNGGIINYLQFIKKTKKNSKWDGECFVFDDRISIDKKLERGKFYQCYGCRHPITKEDKLSKFYKKGVHCHYCYKKRTVKQKNNSKMRQMQIDKAEKLGIDHSFKKIKLGTVSYPNAE